LEFKNEECPRGKTRSYKSSQGGCGYGLHNLEVATVKLTTAFSQKCPCPAGCDDEALHAAATALEDRPIGLDSCCDIPVVNDGLEMAQDAVGVITTGGKITAERGIGDTLYGKEKSINVPGSEELYPMSDVVNEHHTQIYWVPAGSTPPDSEVID